MATFLVAQGPARADTWQKVRAEGRLVYGSDAEGGAPYLYPDPDNPQRIIGFEPELMDCLARRMGVTAAFQQNQWDRLLQVLETGRVDVVVNGYEWTEERAREDLASRPYYVYQLQLIAPNRSPLRGWDDFRDPKPGGGRWRVGVLSNSEADSYAHRLASFLTFETGADRVEVTRYDGTTDAMKDVLNGRLDATVQDTPAAAFFLKETRYEGLRKIGPPVGGGTYVMYVRPGDEALREQLDRGLRDLIASGELREIYQRYGIWNDAQEELASLATVPAAEPPPSRVRDWAEVLWANVPALLIAARMTILLSVVSMPLAMALGLGIALGRLYGPKPLRWVLVGYVELIRGTPLMLQLFVLYFLLPELGVVLPAWAAGIAGLAINYSAYEAEIYRAGLQAIPPGQMEASLALGMSRGLALRRVILPQAVRIVIPPVTSDFITLFKDSSVCSVIGLVELSKQYSILVNNNGQVVAFGLAVATLYLVMSLPLSRLSLWLEKRLEGEGTGA